MAGIVHDWLCQRAYHWLLTAGMCRWALRETGESKAGERPDALGWAANYQSILIECKATRTDFHKDKKKLFRDPELWGKGLGQERYYMAPPGILTPDMLPEAWGLLECHKYKVIKVKPAAAYRPSRDVLFNEVKLLFNLFADLQSVPFAHYFEHDDAVSRINMMLGDECPWENKKAKQPPPVFR